MYECIADDQVRCYQTLQVLTPSANFARLGLGLVGLWTLSPQSRARGKLGECRGRRAEPPRPLHRAEPLSPLAPTMRVVPRNIARRFERS